MRLIALIVFVMTILIGACFVYWRATPSYTFYQVREAVRNHDTESFEQFVDLEATISDVVDQAIEDSAGDETDEDESIAGTVVSGLTELMKPQLLRMARDKILKSIETGRLETPKNEIQESFAPVVSALNDDKKYDFQIESIRTTGKIVTAKITLSDKGKLIARINVLMRDKGFYKQIIAIKPIYENGIRKPVRLKNGILFDGAFAIPEQLVKTAQKAKRFFIIVYDSENLDVPFGVGQLKSIENIEEPVSLKIELKTLQLADQNAPVPHRIRIKLRFDKDGEFGPEQPGDLIGDSGELKTGTGVGIKIETIVK